MATSGTGGSEWLGSIKKILDADTLLKDRNNEILADELTSSVGFPFQGQEQLELYAFWDVMIEKLRANGYRIVDDLYICENNDEELKHRRKLIEDINRYINK